jgi:Spy/CpxP family protein refolding chaperone
MNRSLKNVYMLLAALFLGWGLGAQAQSTATPPADSTHHHNGMHRGWGNKPGGNDHQSFRDDRQAAHNNYRGRQGFGGRGERIHYTPEQRTQVMAINKEYRQKAAELYKQDNSTLKQYKAGLLALQKEKKDKLAALLTPQQKTEIATRRKRMDENRQVMEVARLERLKLRLNLSDDQVAKIKAGQENLRSQFKAIHENDNLLPQQKMEQMKSLMAKRNDTFKSVLTPEQYSQFEKMHHRPGGRRFGRPDNSSTAI